MTCEVNVTGKVSIIIPCFNHGATLRETLASIASVRTANLLEVIIVNDGSTDPHTTKTLAELDGYLYTVLHQTNAGLGAARNAGIRMARGEFILPLDSDNLIQAAYLTQGIGVLQKNPDIGVVYGDAEYFGEKTGRWFVPEFDLINLIGGNYIDACALYRRSVWEQVGGYDEKMPWMGYEDWDFWLRVAARGWKFQHLPEIAFDYRVSGGSMLNSVTNAHMHELNAYIAAKKELQVLRLLLQKELELRRLYQIEQSKEFRLGRVLLKPLRWLKNLVDGTGSRQA